MRAPALCVSHLGLAPCQLFTEHEWLASTIAKASVFQFKEKLEVKLARG